MKLEEIQSAIRAEGLDGWLFYDHHRRDPLAYRILGLPDVFPPTRRWYYFIPRDSNPQALCHRIEPNVLDSLPGEKHYYSRWAEQKNGIQSLLGKARTIAMQHSPECALPYIAMVDAGTIDLVRSLGVAVQSSANLVQLFEARWTPIQLESHFEAGRRMDRIRVQAFELIRERTRNGAAVSELEVQTFLRQRFKKEDLETDHGPIVAVNANASDPHYEPAEGKSIPIRRGDLVLVDMWAKLRTPGAVYYDITWTAFCGDIPSPQMLAVFGTVAEARDTAVRFVADAIRHNTAIAGYQVDDVARDHIEQAGFGRYFIHRTGHSIGTDVHGAGANMDNFETHDERRILPSTCFSIEPGIYLPNFGIRSEVNVFVSEQDARVTGDLQTEILAL